MEKLSSTLAGFQLALVPEVEAYWLENPPVSSTSDSQNGSTSATYLREEKFTPEQPPQETKPTPQKPTSTRRHRSKGKASGWIETREGNTRRRVTNTSFYYCYYQWEGDERRKRKIYIPNRWISHLRSLIEAETTVEEIIQFLNGARR